MEPSSTVSWDQLKLNRQLLNAVEKAGFLRPTEIQQKAIPLIHGGQAVIGIAQTGTGKTAAYLLPLLKKLNYAQGVEPRALVLAPTKELVVQIAEHARILAEFTDLRMAVLYGGVGPQTQIKTLNAGADLLVATPGRFMEIYFRKEIPVKQIKTLVIDEADRMLDMAFIQQLRKILEVIPSRRQNLLFSATFPQKVEKFAAEFLEFPVRVEVTPQASAAESVDQEVIRVSNLKTKINLLEFLLSDRDEFKRVMIFTRTKETADNVFRFIERKNLGPVRVIHSNKGQNTRINAMNEFKSGNIRILVCTDVSARGIDVSAVSHVINFEVPAAYEDYVHRIGRTGRAFHAGKAITFVTPPEQFHIARIEGLIREKIKVRKLDPLVVVEATPDSEARAMDREIDRQKRIDDPEFKGAYHEKKSVSEKKEKRRRNLRA